MRFANVCIESLGYELPPNVVTSASLYDELEPTLRRLQIPADGLQALTGVEERRFWDRGASIHKAAARAARKAMDAAGIAPTRIGCLINTSVSREYVEPSTAMLVHGELGLGTDCLSFDLGNACLAFLNGLSILADMLEKEQIEYGLVVNAEDAREVTEATVQRLRQPDTDGDRLREEFAALTLGSGAVAAVVTHQRHARAGHRLTGHVTLADSTYSQLCLGKPTRMVTDHKMLLAAGVALAERTWQRACETFHWTVDSVDLFVCHQVTTTHHRAIFDKLGLDVGKSFVTFPFLGNVGPASVPLTLALAAERGRVHVGDRVALFGIGSGLNCSLMELMW